jgi:hypothetical protein
VSYKKYAVGLEMSVPAAPAAGPLKSPSARDLARSGPQKCELVHNPGHSIYQNRYGSRVSTTVAGRNNTVVVRDN